jgi:hypothetical protein
MKKILLLFAGLVISSLAMAQSDIKYIDVVNILSGNTDILKKKGYELKNVAKGQNSEYYYIKGDMKLTDDMQWHSANGKGGVAILTRSNDGKPLSLDVHYSNVKSMQTVANEMVSAKAQPKGVSQEADKTVYNFQTEVDLIQLTIPNGQTMMSMYVIRR